MRTVGALIGALLLVGFVLAYWWAILLAVFAVAGFYIARWAYREHRARLAAARVRVAGLIARADRQHAWVLAGDDRGVYGAMHTE